ncbi:hypothetical protein [Parerythrobacter jejuensis]|uniref:Nuclear transport factor 2 family protein n=1 Tax=Parerythrobacter jejuensis TaxID=795812 RepID=A0A845AN90_9SPHN|nr:hypothetical protein [Parerythrobacter jejuensis]MXP30365.1 hypothetical protein [Parerythrobacter jejuensis]MXP33125.1 hypothetical protein [Parerythrobacter jejuensis]
MRGFDLLAGLSLALAAPASAGEPMSDEKLAVAEAVTAFMGAIGSDTKTDLADHMVPEAVIFVHSRMDPANPRIDVIPVADHLDRWATRTARYLEEMTISTILVDGDMAVAWGPYAFWADYKLSHCGINSLSLVRRDSGWKIANTSFTMELPSKCEELGVPGFPAESVRDETP